MECDDTSPASSEQEKVVPVGRRPGRRWLWAAVGVLLVLGWQAATVHVNYDDNWTGLFRVGHAALVFDQGLHDFLAARRGETPVCLKRRQQELRLRIRQRLA